MKTLNILTLLLVVIGGINWGLVGFFQYDLVATLFGGQAGMIARTVYALVGLSALWQLIPLITAMKTGEVQAERRSGPLTH